MKFAWNFFLSSEIFLDFFEYFSKGSNQQFFKNLAKGVSYISFRISFSTTNFSTSLQEFFRVQEFFRDILTIFSKLKNVLKIF